MRAMPAESQIIALNPNGAVVELRASPLARGLVELADVGMTRIMTTDVALELCFQLLRAVEHTATRRPRRSLAALARSRGPKIGQRKSSRHGDEAVRVDEGGADRHTVRRGGSCM